MLGLLRLWRGDDEVDPGAPRRAGPLALLLARKGARRLVELLGDTGAPPTTLNVV